MSAAGGAMAGILMANNLVRLQKGLAEARVTWPQLAVGGLELGTEAGPLLQVERERPVLRGTVRGVPCTVRVVADLVYCAYTEVTAVPVQAREAVVGVHPSPGGVLSRLRDWLHQDIQLGDPAFDEAFLVTARPVEAAAALLRAEVRERLAALGSGRMAGFVAEPGRVAVVFGGVETDLDALRMAIDLAVDAAGGEA